MIHDDNDQANKDRPLMLLKHHQWKLLLSSRLLFRSLISTLVLLLLLLPTRVSYCAAAESESESSSSSNNHVTRHHAMTISGDDVMTDATIIIQPDNMNISMSEENEGNTNHPSTIIGNNGTIIGNNGTMTINPFIIRSSAEPHEAYKILGVKGPDSRNKETRSTKSIYILSSFLQSFTLNQFQRKFKRAVWKWHGKLIPLLHWQDWVETRFLSLVRKGGSTTTTPPPPKELFVNLRVLWNKAISSLDPSSPVYEGYKRRMLQSNDISSSNEANKRRQHQSAEPVANHNSRCCWHHHHTTYRLLPPTTRWVLSIIPSFLFPRWFHANIELRTAYLNRAIQQLIDNDDIDNDIDWRKKQQVSEQQQQQQQQVQDDDDDQKEEEGGNRKIRLVILGAGYDTRSIRLLLQERVDQIWEFDLPPVMESKRWLLNRRGLWKFPIPFHRYYEEKKHGSTVTTITTATSTTEERSNAKLQCIGLDLNQPESFREALEQLLKGAEEEQEIKHDGEEGGSSFSSCDDEWYTIVISEALFLYLEPDIPAKLLTICHDLFLGQNGSIKSRKKKKESWNAKEGSRSSPSTSSSLAFCFADRILEVPLEQAYDVSAIQQWFDKIGWTLVDWMPKEGATRQMGISRPKLDRK